MKHLTRGRQKGHGSLVAAVWPTELSRLGSPSAEKPISVPRLPLQRRDHRSLEEEGGLMRAVQLLLVLNVAEKPRHLRRLGERRG